MVFDILEVWPRLMWIDCGCKANIYDNTYAKLINTTELLKWTMDNNS